MKTYAHLALTFLLLSLIFSMGQLRTRQEVLASQLSPEILRFHVLANSDTKKDQTVKLEVRSLILDFIQGKLPREAGKEDTIAYLKNHRSAIETTANRYLQKQGFPYTANLEVTNCYFPTKTYDDFSFPSGYYDAARITLGKGKGRNWWCVLYPRLCFVDEVCTEVPMESRKILLEKLGQSNYLALKDSRPVIETRFFFLPKIVLPTPQ